MPTNFDKLFNQAQGDALINVLGGIKSSLDGNYPLEDLTVTLTNEPQILVPNNNYGFNSVSVPAVNLEPLSVTENGTYNASVLGYDGFLEVEVNVSGGGSGNLVINKSGSLQSTFNSPVDIQTNDCAYLFYNFNAFNQTLNLPDGVTNCYQMLYGCKSYDKPVTIPDSVINTCSMFQGCSNFNNEIILPNNAVNCASMFSGCTKFNQPINIPDSAISIWSMFSACSNFNQPINIPENCQNIAQLFSGCINYNQPTVIPNNLSTCVSVFSSCTSFSQPINIPEKVYMATRMFDGCSTFNQPVEILGNNLRNAEWMFANCYNFNQSMILSSNYTGSYANYSNMFLRCNNLNSPIYLYAYNIGDTYNMFNQCNSLSEVYINNLRSNTQLRRSFRINGSQRLNIYTDDASAALIKTTTPLLCNGAAVTASTWTDDVDNGCYYNEAYNIYVYNNWDGVIPT